MTKPAKLYVLLLQSTNRSVNYRDFVAMVEAFGFRNIRTRGSHSTYANPACGEPLNLQPKGKDAKRYQIRYFLDIVEEYGLTLED